MLNFKHLIPVDVIGHFLSLYKIVLNILCKNSIAPAQGRCMKKSLYGRGQKYFNVALVLQDEWLSLFTRPANTCTCPLKVFAIKNIRELYAI